jgi:hypothetical protein
MSLHDKFLRLPKVQMENIRKAQEKWDKSGIIVEVAKLRLMTLKDLGKSDSGSLNWFY